MMIRVRTVVILVVLAAAAAFGCVYFGVYNVAATRQDSAPVYYFLHYAMRRSVHARAESIQMPDLRDARYARNGFALYRQHCLQCHGAPGVAPDPFGFGLRPAPPNLVEAAREWRTPDIYWVIKNGLGKTGMPAWEYRLSEQQLWELTAFVKQLPLLSPLDYRDLERAQEAAPSLAALPANVEDRVPLGNPDAGRRAVEQYLCFTCHKIPGVTGANANVGPPLNGIATRKYIGGVLLNTPENMMRWLRNPQEIDPLSAMPPLQIKERDLRDIAAYLYTLPKDMSN